LISRDKHQGGFTLVEFMIAITVLAVALLAMAGLQSTAIRSNADSKWQTAATTITEEKLVQLKNTGYTALANTGWTSAESVTLTGLGTFYRTYQVTDAVASYLKKIEVQVTYTNTKGVSKQVNLSTFLAKSN
jgi:prepilin-type N-terminal cleavage/methylation domain-containing protein